MIDAIYLLVHQFLVIFSGDSDFSALVSKLRENNKTVVGVGVKQSTSDLLIANCDEFIFYDGLLRQGKKPRILRSKATDEAPPKRTGRQTQEETKKQTALDLVLETMEDLFEERGEGEKVWGSMVKQTLKRRKPDFSETYYGFRSFGHLLEEAEARKLLKLERDEKSGGYVIRGHI